LERAADLGGAHGLDPKFTTKVRDVVGLYVDPPEHAFVLWSTRNRKFNSGDRPHPTGTADEEVPLRDDDHDYKRHGTMTPVHGARCTRRQGHWSVYGAHRHQEFIRFLKRSTARPRPDVRYSDDVGHLFRSKSAVRSD
jgi:hypothetical protein